MGTHSTGVLRPSMHWATVHTYLEDEPSSLQTRCAIRRGAARGGQGRPGGGHRRYHERAPHQGPGVPGQQEGDARESPHRLGARALASIRAFHGLG